MFLILPPILGLALGLVTGGRVANLERVRVRWLWLFLAALVVRLVAGFTPLSTVDWIRYAYVLGLLAILVWTLLQLKHLPGIWLVSLGLGMNILVILANGVHMPVSPVSGFVPLHPGGTYVVADASTRLNWLGDWIGLPGWLGGAASPGDFVIALGLGVVGFAITRGGASATKLDANPPGSQSGRE